MRFANRETFIEMFAEVPTNIAGPQLCVFEIFCKDGVRKNVAIKKKRGKEGD